MAKAFYRLFLCTAVVAICSVVEASVRQDFSGSADQSQYTLTRYGSTPGPQIEDGALKMLSTYSQRNVLAFDQTQPGLFGRIEASWDFSIEPGADGFSFALLNTEHFGTAGPGPEHLDEAPDIDGSFAVGIDVYNPDDYQNFGQHEVSLHFDGRERVKRRSEFDFRTGEFVRADLLVEFVTGGAKISLSLDGHVVYDRYFLANVKVYDSRVAFGSRTGGLRTTLFLDNIAVDFLEATSEPEEPLIVQTFDREQMWPGRNWAYEVFEFPEPGEHFERVLLKLSIDEPDEGWDPWDRAMGLYAWDENEQNRFEIARMMTPYARQWSWWVDVTPFQGLLRDERQLGIDLPSWVWESGGYLISAEFHYYKGNPRYEVAVLENLWVGQPWYGELHDPTMSNFFTRKRLVLGDSYDKVVVRMMVTGHGQSPNTDAGAEFIRRGRTLTARMPAGVEQYYDMLWKDDCYLNPCRPQGGTWRFSRAGWAPGDVVEPWEVQIQSQLDAHGRITLEYEADEYFNYSFDHGNPSRHWVESQIIAYRQLSCEEGYFLPGDLNQDCVVDFLDLAELARGDFDMETLAAIVTWWLQDNF